MPRFLAIDLGTKRIGVACGDTDTRLAIPLSTLHATGKNECDVEVVLALASEYETDGYVVGLPLNMDGTEGEACKLARRFGDLLGRLAEKPVHYWDERLSSVAAEELLRPAELTRKKRKARLDRVAAQVILQGFLDARGEQPDAAAPDDSPNARDP